MACAKLLATGRLSNALAAEDGLEALHLLRAVRPPAPPEAPLPGASRPPRCPGSGGNEFRPAAQLGDPTVGGTCRVRRDVRRLRSRAGGAQAMGAVATLAKPLNVEPVDGSG